jgi:hypothetical protein
MAAETPQLIFDVSISLSGQSRRGRIALSRSAVAPVAISDGETLRVTYQRGSAREGYRHDRDL